MTTVRRWVAGPNSFTLDFGGYADYYSSQTEEGETISQLIAGYIDIILKKKQEQDQRGAGVTSEAVMAEVCSMRMAALKRCSLTFTRS